jgi:hypothetical protein
MILVRRQVLQEPNLLFANLTDWQEANFLHNLLADFDVTWHRCLASQFGVSQSIEIVVFAHAFGDGFLLYSSNAKSKGETRRCHCVCFERFESLT